MPTRRYALFFALLAGLATALGTQGAPPPKPVADGTKRMVERLARLPQQADPAKHPFVNAARVELARRNLAGTTDPKAQIAARFRLAQELVKAGKVDEALEVLSRVEQDSKAYAAPGTKGWVEFKLFQAVAYLRKAEFDNCQMHHNPESCLFPVRGGGVHAMRAGAEGAQRTLLELLQAQPDDRRARWLLNVAAMTLGNYPDAVPKRWLLAPELFRSDYEIGRFQEIATRLGLDVDDLAGGAIAEDFDGDGDLDLMCSAWGMASQIRLFRNNGDGSFTERTAAAGLTGIFGGLNIRQADYDNDGDADVLVLRGGWWKTEGHHPKSLLRNNGDGTFSDVAEAAGVLSPHPTQTAAWLDYDGDGWLDLYIGHESLEDDPNPCELYRNNRDGTFTEVGAASGVANLGYVKGVTAGDYDNDGRPDLYLSRLKAANVLYHNDGPQAGGRWKFSDVSARAGVTDPFYSFPTWFFDYDNDGRLDLFVSGYAIRDVGDYATEALGEGAPPESLPRLYHNRGDGTFADVTKAAHLDKILLTMGSNFGDLDNDGWLDFYLGTGDPDLATLIPNRMFRNADGRLFQDVTTSGGFGHLQKGHGVAFADLDNDGDQDIYITMGGAYEVDHFRNALFENPGHAGNHALVLKLEGVRANRAGIGARIKVVVDTGAGERTIYKSVGSGGSFGGNPLRAEIGLGTARAIRSVEILWPGSGTKQTVSGLALDRAYRIREGEAVPIAIELKRFKLGAAR